MNENKTVLDQIKRVGKKAFDWIVRYPLALLISVGVILFAVFLMLNGKGNRFNVGGIIGSLFGKDEDSDRDRITKANKIPDDRVNSNGEPIEKGVTDSEGYAQKEVKPLDQSKNPFRDKSKITIKDEAGNDKKISLPDGVIDTDVDQIFEVAPEVFKVKVKLRPEQKVSNEDLDVLKPK